ncbi:MAG: DegT/DnrJ/EryC1/StrS family aminotransferase [Bacteroidales bacterium]|nr:DegT/DnrJ/EryC1/StrS family aminotransferase [Bacteroidales bacterium]
MKKKNFTRRNFIATVSAGSVAAVGSNAISAFAGITVSPKANGKLAILGGNPVRKNKPWPEWPYVDEKMVEAVSKTTRSRIWCRIQSENGTVPTFEKEFAKMMDAKFSLGTGSGTQALSTCVEALGFGPGDEIITSPLTDPGTLSSILTSRVLPVLADIDRESFQIDPDDVERRINENTKAIMPVQIGGQPCNMDRIMAIAKKHNLKVIEDAAQAHLAVYKGKKLGTIGDLGCFSFQASKTIACGEGGAVIGNDEELMDKCFTVQNHGTNRKGRTVVIGPKYRMNEFEAAILLSQFAGVKERFETRNRNAMYLNSKLKGFPGLVPQKFYEGTESGSFYLYMTTYLKEHFNNTPRDKFLKALEAEGVSLSPYLPKGLHKEPWTDHILSLREYQKMYSPARLKSYREELSCPNCDRVIDDIAMIWASGPLLGSTEDMDDIINAIMKLHENRDQLNQI